MAQATTPVLLRSPSELRAWRRGLDTSGSSASHRRVGFVPTMGALHAGHEQLLRRAAAENDVVVLSIFVNPAQFGPAEDLSSYPRTLEADLAMAARCGVHAVFLPVATDMYASGFASRVGVSPEYSGHFEGASRPGHFDGVCLVVTLLLHLVQPGIMYLGQKDYQQVVVLRRLVQDLAFDTEICVVPTVRDSDGLALSSRNRYLSQQERLWARSLPMAMAAVSSRFLGGERAVHALQGCFRQTLLQHLAQQKAPSELVLEYDAVFDAWTLRPILGAAVTGDAVYVAVLQVPSKLREGRVVRLLDSVVLSRVEPWKGELARLVAACDDVLNKEV